MKKFNLVLSVMICMMISGTAFAQGFGVRAGVNIANQNWENEGLEISPDAITGFQFGVSYEMALSEALYFNPAVMYSIKGSKFEIDFLGEKFEIKSTFNYLDIPLDFVYKIGLSNLGVTAHAGPYLSYLLSYGSEEDGEKEDGDLDDTNRLDYGLNFGAGVEIGKIQIGLNYGLGFGNIVADVDDDEDISVKNKVFSITAGFRF